MKKSLLFLGILGLFCIQLHAQRTIFKYDKNNRLSVIINADGKTINYSYDKDGNRIFQRIGFDSTLLPNPGIITGSATVCVGNTISLTNSILGGAWSATNSKAMVAGGVVTGVSVGTDTIIYTVTNSYGSSTTQKIISIITTPSTPAAITGPKNVCVGSSIILANSTPSGIWSSDNSLVTVAGNTVIGVSPGISTISYTVSNSCGSAWTTYPITVNPAPNAGTITGNFNVCEGSTLQLSNIATGGAWTSSVPSYATISSTGLVLGISPGVTNISYTATNTCGFASTSHLITVFSISNCDAAGVATFTSNEKIKVYPNPSEGSFTVEIPTLQNATTLTIEDILGQVLESRTIRGKTCKETFQLNKVARGIYIVKIASCNMTDERRIIIR